MSFRGGRDRQWKDYPLRPEEKSHHGRNTVPPSRHLWVGNLSHSLTERALSNHFRQFGELESVAFSPGRSYAFINFIEDNAAFAAFGALQGFILAGNALRIEFAKAEKSSSTPSHDEDEKYLHRRDEPRSPFPQRDSRIRHSNSDPTYHNNNNDNQKPTTKDDEEPNEVLWVGFPQSLKVDEHIFWNTFSPFGEIEKISSYPGRTYAFIRYKHVNSAIRAKDNLQGKLFGNPRVHITFARSETRGSNTGKNSIPDPPSPRYGRQYHDDRKRRSPLTDRNHGFRDTGYDGYGRRSPSRDRNVNFHNFPPHRQVLYDDEWDLPEDALIFHGAKKMKGGLIPIPIPIPMPIPNEPELPEYPFSDSEHMNNTFSRPPGFDNNNMGHFGFHNQMIHDPNMNVNQPYVERGNTQNTQINRNTRNTQNTLNPAYDGFHGGPVSLPQNAIEWKRPTPEPHIPASEEWKWEGVIAKGGTSICRARCFPVGKVLDMLLPKFLDCTARTSLDMLAKHYYQAATSYVVFFVPESDADMAFYNEFMNYLGEKQRAAVAKLDDKTTLFLVPPSDFSEKILKVPGKLSISGVILRLEQPPTTVETHQPPPPPVPPQRQPERQDPYVISHGESSRMSFASASPSGNFQLQNVGKPRPGMTAVQGLPFHVDNTPDHFHHHQSGGRPPRSGGEFMNLNNQETSLSNYKPGSPVIMQEYGHQEQKSVVTGGIQQEQLAQLASFLGNARQSMGEEIRQPSNVIGLDSNGYNRMMPHQIPSPSQHPSSQYHQVPSQQMSGYHQVGQSSGQGNGQEETEADPQKRLQATLELAATLLKQIQQGKT